MPSQEEITTQLELLRTNRRTLAYGLEQLGRFGPSYTPPNVRADIDDARAAIGRIKQTLRGWQVAVDDLPDDAPAASAASAAPAVPDLAQQLAALGIAPGAGINPNDLQTLARALQAQSQASGDGNLYRALLNLDYRSQTGTFAQSVAPRSLAAYLIDGPRLFGQRWLLNRLLKRYERSIQPISIDLRRLGRGKSVADLCQEIGRKAGVAASTPEQIATVLCKWWETQHTILIFHSIDLVGEAALNAILSGFWAPIVAIARQSPCCAGSNKLLLFLVDNQGSSAGWNVPIAQGPADDPARPVRLPTIARFSSADLADWIEASLIDLPDDFSTRTDPETILAHSDDGIPESVLEEICVVCDYDWNEGASRWLKH
ncbi:hypothetical protein [Kouleothrix sp.]|uniref:hypothetical protein n=1 Tax=Kouleothrix sp. TaxID=2779161 RepID=UPI00391A329D